MSPRYVSLPAVGRRIPLGAYVAGWKMAKANPEQTFRHGLNHAEPATGASVLFEFREGMHDRINTRGGIDSAYRPRLFAHRWDMQSYHLPETFLLSTLAKNPRVTPHLAVEYVLGQFDYEIEYESARKVVNRAVRNRLIVERNGAYVLTRRGKRALSKRIRAICRVH